MHSTFALKKQLQQAMQTRQAFCLRLPPRRKTASPLSIEANRSSLSSVRRLPAPPLVVLSSPALVTVGTKGGPAPYATASAAEAAADSEKQKPSLDGARLPSPVPCVLVRPAHLNLPCRSAATSPEICRTGDPRSRRDGPPPALPPTPPRRSPRCCGRGWRPPRA